MERGFLWLPLLGLFGWLAWAGWNDYQTVEAYRHWATQFQKAKYDIHSVLGTDGDQLVWGKPSRRGLIDRQTLPLEAIQTIALQLDQTACSLDQARQWAATATPPRQILLNLAIANPEIANPEIANPEIANPDIANPEIAPSPDRPTSAIAIPFTELTLALEWAEWLTQRLGSLDAAPGASPGAAPGAAPGASPGASPD